VSCCHLPICQIHNMFIKIIQETIGFQRLHIYTMYQIVQTRRINTKNYSNFLIGSQKIIPKFEFFLPFSYQQSIPNKQTTGFDGVNDDY
jgi:hypothetical protein